MYETYDSSGHDLTWVPIGTAMDPDYATSPINGTYSLRRAASTSQAGEIHTLASGVSEIYISFAYKLLASSGARDLLTIRDSSDTEIASIRVTSTTEWVLNYANAASSTAGSHDFSSGNIYYIGLHYKADASSATFDAWVSTTPLGSNWGTADKSGDGRAFTSNVDEVQVGIDGSIWNLGELYDEVWGSSTELAWDGN
jgi:hypothetical protein